MKHKFQTQVFVVYIVKYLQLLYHSEINNGWYDIYSFFEVSLGTWLLRKISKLYLFTISQEIKPDSTEVTYIYNADVKTCVLAFRSRENPVYIRRTSLFSILRVFNGFNWKESLKNSSFTCLCVLYMVVRSYFLKILLEAFAGIFFL